MGLELAKPTIDIGIVTTDRKASAAFYGDVLGLPRLGELRMDGFTISRFQVGDCVLKILEFDRPPPPGWCGEGWGRPPESATGPSRCPISTRSWPTAGRPAARSSTAPHRSGPG